METVRKYGKEPYQICLLHGGPGAAGELRTVALYLSDHFGILEFLQTEDSVEGQIEELHCQLASNADLPAILVGYSWGAWLGFLFAARYPDLIKKLILVSSGAFEKRYSQDLMKIRLSRLKPREREEAEKLISLVNSGHAGNDVLRSLGKLVAYADSFEYEPGGSDLVNVNLQMYQKVWTEASRLRDSHELIDFAVHIKCQVVAMHGDYDPHPVDGVEKPLMARLKDFRMILIRQCGHIPWKEKHAKETFYEVLGREIQPGAQESG